MAFINLKHKTIQLKIVYYGPGRGGKTTNVEYIFNKFKDKANSDITTIATQGDKTLFFDYTPLNLPNINGFDVTIQLYSAPGQVKYDPLRSLVLNGVDGIVFVADSMEVRRKSNIASLQDLTTNLVKCNKSIFDIPLVIQLNKRDLEKQGIPLMGADEMKAELNTRLNAPVFEACAATGDNVIATLKKIISLTQKSLVKPVK